MQAEVAQQKRLGEKYLTNKPSQSSNLQNLKEKVDTPLRRRKLLLKLKNKRMSKKLQIVHFLERMLISMTSKACHQRDMKGSRKEQEQEGKIPLELILR